MTDIPTHTLPTRRDAGWLDWPTGRIVWLAISIVLALIMSFVPPLTVVLLFAGVIGALPSSRYGYLYRLPATVASNRSFRRHDGLAYTRSLDDDAIDYNKNEQSRPAPLELDLQGLPVEDQAGVGHLLGVVHSRKTYQDTLITVSDGNGAAAFGDAMTQMLCNVAFAETLKEVAGASAANLELTQFFMTRRADDNIVGRYLATHMHPEVREGMSESDRRLRDNLYQATDYIYAGARDITMGVALTAKRPRAWRTLPPDGLTAEQAGQAPIMRLTNVLERGLPESGATRVRRLGMLELNALIRAYTDPVNVTSMYDELAADRQRLVDDSASSIDDMLTLRRGPWPSHIRTHGSYCILGGSYHRVLMSPGLKREQVPPGFFRRMLQLRDTDYAVALSAKTHSQNREMRRARSQRMTAMAKASGRNRRGEAILVEPRDEEALRRTTDQHHLLYASGAHGVRYTIRIAVAAASLAELEAATETVKQEFRRELQLEAYEDSAVHLRAIFAMIGLAVT